MSYNITKMNAPNRQQVAAKFQTFEDLEVYKSARELCKAMYSVQRRLPTLEKYELGSQIRRAAVSLTNNIAEGHGRFHFPDQIRFFLQSCGSLEELVDDLNICCDEECLNAEQVTSLKEQAPARPAFAERLSPSPPQAFVICPRERERSRN